MVTGHSEVSSFDDLNDYHRMLVDGIAHVKTMIAGGRTVEDIVASGLPQEWAGTVPDGEVARWYQAIHRSLTIQE